VYLEKEKMLREEIINQLNSLLDFRLKEKRGERKYQSEGL